MLFPINLVPFERIKANSSCRLMHVYCLIGITSNETMPPIVA